MGRHVLRAGRRRIGARLLVTCALAGGSVISLAGLAQPVHAAASEVLILGSSVSGGSSSAEAAEVSAKGYTPVVVDDATWQSMTTSQFASYKALVIGDPSCSETAPAAAVATAAVWGPAVSGNTVIIGTDPVLHGKTQFVDQGIDFALAGKTGTTGGYLDLSCNYDNQPTSTDASMLDGLRGTGAFKVHTAQCYNTVHIVATHPAFAGLTDSYMSGWSCSVHEVFDSWPGDFQVLAIAKDYNSVFTASDGTVGAPYVLASGSGLHSFPLSLDPLSQSVTIGRAGTVTAQLLDATTGQPVAGTRISFRIVSGPGAGATGTCAPVTCATDAAGKVTWTYGDTSGDAGTDTVQAWLDQNGDGIPSSGEPQTTAAVTWAPAPVTPPHLNLGDYKIAGTAQEPSIAVDPANPRHVVIGYNSHTLFGYFHCSFATTWDGGRKWSLGTLGSVQGQGGSSDPSVVFAPNGHVFYACLTDRAHFFGPTDEGVGIYMSNDGGKSFTGVTEAATGIRSQSGRTESLDDQESLAVGGDGRLHVCATQYNSSSDNTYVEVFDSSDASGRHWTLAKAISTGAHDTTGCGIAVTGTGRVWVSWWDKTAQEARVAYRDRGAGRWSPAITIGTKNSETAGRQVRLAADPRAKAAGVIAIWPTTFSGHNVAMLAYTTGTSWYGACGALDASPCLASAAGSDINEPAVSWGADGRILIGYYEVTHSTDKYVIGRAEGISQPFGFTTAASAPTDPSAYKPFHRLGDYTAVAEGSNGAPYAAWSDTRSGRQELWGAS